MQNKLEIDREGRTTARSPHLVKKKTMNETGENGTYQTI